MTKIETCATATRKPESFDDPEGVLNRGRMYAGF